jgi:hypothetical protein
MSSSSSVAASLPLIHGGDSALPMIFLKLEHILSNHVAQFLLQ